MTRGGEGWEPLCAISRLHDKGSLLLRHRGRALVLFLLPDTEPGLCAIAARDPFAGADLIAEGLLNKLGDGWVVTSPFHKHQFRLQDGQCLEDETVKLTVWPVRHREGEVQIRWSDQY